MPVNSIILAWVNIAYGCRNSSYDLFIAESPEFGQADVRRKIAGITDTSRVLSCFGSNSREQYRMYVEGKLSHAEQEMLIQKDIGEDEIDRRPVRRTVCLRYRQKKRNTEHNRDKHWREGGCIR